VYQFGIVDEELDKHTHFIYSEAASGKGSDEVASMVLNYLEKFPSRKSSELILWADNCGGQNKNSTLIHTCMYLVESKSFESVQLKFQIKGHTRNSVDRGFGYTKREYNRSEVYSIECLQDILKRSCTGPHGSQKIFLVVINGPDVFRRYSKFYISMYQKIKDVQKYQIFKAESFDKTKIFCMHPSKPDNWDNQTIKLSIFLKNELDIIPFKGWNKEKIVDFYRKVRPDIPENFKNSLCPKPEDELEEEVKKLKSQRQKDKH